MVYLPSDKAAWVILSELNMCVYTYTKMKQLNFLLRLDGMQEHANHVSG